MERRADASDSPAVAYGHRRTGPFHLSGQIDPVVVTMRFVASDPSRVAAIISRYVVEARRSDGCINVDFCLSSGNSSVFVVISKWASPTTQRAHFDAPLTVEMAEALTGLLVSAPAIELLDPISAHDLR